jgi:hypothetical protein
MIIKKVLATFCSVCPFCILARSFPESGYARMLGKAEKYCPACQARQELLGKDKCGCEGQEWKLD